MVPDDAEHSHRPEDIAARLRAGPAPSYLKDYVYGAIDGTVTTFAVVSGVAGAGLPLRVVLVLGMANLVGDGFSMAASNFLGTRSEAELRARARRMEERHLERFPEGEREEVRQIYARKGFAGEDLERAVAVVTADRERWIEAMLADELGLAHTAPRALRAATATFVAFVLVGLVPLLAFLPELFSTGARFGNPYVLSAAMTAVTFFAVGAAKSRFVERRWFGAGLETLAVGGAAAALAYGVGAALGGLPA